MYKLHEYPDPILRKYCDPIKNFDSTVATLVSDMLQLVVELKGVGLAAPQIGIDQRVFVIKTEQDTYEFINPTIIEVEGEQISEEGCLSIPEVRVRIKRYSRIKVKAYNRLGQQFTLDTRNNLDLARIIQHENDHLNGILITDHVSNLKKPAVMEKLAKLQKKANKQSKKSKPKTRIKKH